MSLNYKLDDFFARSTDTPLAETELANVLKALPSVGKDGPWLAGGALRRTLLGKPPESDFDFFFKNPEQFDSFKSDLIKKGLSQIHETEHHVHFRGTPTGSNRERDIQCIRFQYYNSAPDVIDSFDFTICQFGYDGETLYAGDHSLWDLGRMRLAVHKITYPVASMRRILKYANQGFKACNGCLSEVLRQTANSPENMARLGVFYID